MNTVALEKQVQIYGIDTGNFYTNREARLHWKNHKIKLEKRRLKREKEENQKEINKLAKKLNDIDKTSPSCQTNEDELKLSYRIDELITRQVDIDEWIKQKNKHIALAKNDLLTLLANKVKANEDSNGRHHTRILNEDGLSDSNIISVFDSMLTRTIGLESDKLTDAFMVIQVYYYDVIKDLIYHGYEYKGERYIFYTASAGQIRQKKVVFIKESLWNKYEKSLMCGLSLDIINSKGGNNPN